MADQRSEDRSKRPASRRVADELRSAIESGVYPVGTALPGYRQLATRYGVAVNTAMAAVRLLREEGLVDHRPNAGNYVRDRRAQPAAEQDLGALRAELAELQRQLRQAGVNLAAIEQRLSEVVVRLRALEG